MTPPATRITVFGGTWPAQIWQLFTSAALAETPASDFAQVPPPPTTTTTFGPLITVPSVLGTLEGDARSLLQRNGYQVVTDARASRDYPPGTVFDQTPAPGTVASPGSTVTIVVATGAPKTVVVPNVLNQFADDAVAQLHDAGLAAKVIVQAEPPPGSPSRKGKSWKQSPAASAAVDAGSTVVVWVNPE
jgi:beta-lactam-binding protein with PASTA domain